MRIVGLTGGIGCGKSTVSDYFESLDGFKVIDCDKISRNVVEPGKPAYAKIIQKFGQDILRENGEIDRRRLGDLVFKNKTKLKTLTDITGPAMFKELVKQIAYNFVIGTPIIILDAPTLYETKKLLNICASVIVVGCDESIQIQRVMKRDNLSEAQIRERMKNQLPTKHKAGMADFVIWNDASKEEALAETGRVATLLTKKYNGFSRLFSGPGFLLCAGMLCMLRIVRQIS